MSKPMLYALSFLVTAVLLISLDEPARAAIVKIETDQAAIPDEKGDPESLFPGLTEEFWISPGLHDRVSAKTCDESARKTTFALIVGYDMVGEFATSGAENDARLFAGSLMSLGLSSDHVNLLVGADATRARLTRAFSDMVDAVGCQDKVILFYAGMALAPEHLFTKADEHGLARERLQAANETGPFLLLSKEVKDIPEAFPLLSDRDLARAAMVLRNIGVDVTVIVDTMSFGGFDLVRRHNEQDERLFWREEVRLGSAEPEQTGADPATAGEPFSEAHRQRSSLLSLATRPTSAAGEITVILPEDQSLEVTFNDGKTYGVMSYFITSALAGNVNHSAQSLARALQEFKLADHTSKQAGLAVSFRSTDPAQPLLAEARQPASKDIIRILEPAPSRGAFEVEDSSISVRGRVAGFRKPLVVLVGRKQARLTDDGGFEAELDLEPGINEIEVLALTEDLRQHRTVFEVSQAVTERQFFGAGRRYAVLIANQDYPQQSGVSRLVTPLADIAALADILGKNYGFELEMKRSNGDTVPLILTEAGSREVQLTLYELSQIATSEDSVLIYYAGHGIYEKRTGNAYWVLADAIAGVPPTFLSADAITDAITRFEATNVLVISDSCYSGALTRSDGGAPLSAEQEDRWRVLQKLSKGRSRILMSSGGEEPVSDGGGEGHSIFAKALIDGLSGFEETAFSARELFDRFLLPRVAGNGNQEPQYRPVAASGHESGDFVFVRVD